MSRTRSLLRLSALPTNHDLALLLLRLWLGGALLWLHGLGKLERLFADEVRFRSVFGLSPAQSLALAVVGEVVAPALLMVGLASRWAAALSAITMATAFTVGHGMALSGERSGELPFIFLAGFLALLIAGPGRYSVDAMGKSSA
mgnify:FL=1